jgi:hypothetical protein
MTYPACSKAYIGQTVCNFSERCNEHLRALRNNCNSSKFAQYLNERMHIFGSLENITQILIYQKKRPTFKQYGTFLLPQRSLI